MFDPYIVLGTGVTMEIRWPVLLCIVKTVEDDFRFTGLPLKIWANSQKEQKKKKKKKNPNIVKNFYE